LSKVLKSIFTNSWVELAARWILGLTFIYASFHKILSPADFAKIIYGYDLFPGGSINLVAIILPFVELVFGLALIAGIYPRSAALIINTMLLAFIIVFFLNMVRGYEFDCGCFSSSKIKNTTSVKLSLLRNAVFFVLGLHVYLYVRHIKGCPFKI